ncbi:MAG: protein kinase [Deltaproteobacteria bacterium]|nr:protein kinase [Deltaproteobacteria bacterium]
MQADRRSTAGAGAEATPLVDQAPTDASEPLLRRGDLVDQFEVMRLLGRGSMGEIYLSRDTKLGRKVALKHPNIVAIHAVGEHHGQPYVALEYLEGQNLRQRRAERPPSLQEAMRMGLAIAEALAEAHRHGVLHLDLKPANVVIPRDGRVRVVDFGLAKTIRQRRKDAAGGEDIELPSGDHVQPSWGAGTPSYMAPERWIEASCTGAADVWSLGLILYELCAHRRPYPGDDPVALVMRVCGPEPVPPVDPQGVLPPPVADLIMRCLDKDPASRPRAEQLAIELRGLLAPEGRVRGGEEAPFRGLLPFAERHAELYFGREAEVVAFVERVRLEPVLCVVGPSGGGKSSFVQAGVIPRLREQEPWLVLALRPGSRPLEALAAQLLSPSGEARSLPASLVEEPTRPILHGLLRPGRSGPWPCVSGERSSGAGAAEDRPSSEVLLDSHGFQQVEALAGRLRAAPHRLALELRAIAQKSGAKVLLFVDQLEELFTIASEPEGPRAFLDAIGAAADHALDPVRVVVTLRHDFIDRVASSPAMRRSLSHLTLIQRPDAEALKETLLKPAQAVGYGYDDPELVAEMVAAVRDEPACLPLLQFAAQMLWNERDRDRKLLLRAAYERMGGVGGALARHADGVLASLSPGEQRAARELCVRLVTPERTRRLLPRSRAIEGLGPDAEPVLARLTEARLVTVRRARLAPGSEPMLELAHESLIHAWDTLGTWLDAGRADLAFLAEVGQAAELWDRRGQLPEELWQGPALRAALAQLERCSAAVPDFVRRFLEQGRRRQARRDRRRRLLVAAAMAVLGAMVLVLAVLKREADAQRERAEAERQQADVQRTQALREGARAALEDGELFEARAKLRAALELGDSPEARALWWRLRREPVLWAVRLGAANYGTAFSPDGASVAVASQDRAVYLFDVATRDRRVLRGHRDQVVAVAFSPDGRQLASGGWDRNVRLWDLGAGTEAAGAPLDSPDTWALAFSPDGIVLAAGSDDGKIRLWDVATRSQRREIAAHHAGVRGVAFAPDGATLLSAGLDGAVRLWKVASGELVRSMEGHEGGVAALGLSRDGRLGASAGVDKTVRLWDVASGKELRVLRGHEAGLRAVAFAPSGRRLVSAGLDTTVRLWDVATGREERVLRGHDDPVVGVAFSPDGSKVVSAGRDNAVRLWDPGRQEGVPLEDDIPDHAARVAFSPDGRTLASGGSDKAIRLWDVHTGRRRGALRRHGGTVTAVRYSPDGRLLASGALDGSLLLWATSSGAVQQVLVGHSAGIYDVAFRADGSLLASASLDQSVRLWDPATGASDGVLSVPGAGVLSAAFSPDGRTLATGCYDRVVRLWSLPAKVSPPGPEPKPAAPRELRGHGDFVSGVSFGPDGRTLASGGKDGLVLLWDVAAGSSRTLAKLPGRAHWLEFDRSGRRLGVPGSDGVAAVIDPATGSQIALRGHRGDVDGMTFSPDGELGATAGDDGTVRLWRASTGKPYWRGPALLRARALGAQPLLLSHRGWEMLAAERQPGRAATEGADDGSAATGAALAAAAGAGPQLRVLLEGRAHHAAQDPSGDLLCVQLDDDAVQLWRMSRDEMLAEYRLPGLEQVIAIPDGCVARTGSAPPGRPAAVAVFASGRTTQLDVDGPPSALGWSPAPLGAASRPADGGQGASAGAPRPEAATAGGMVLVAAGERILLFDAALRPAGRRDVGPGVTALAASGPFVVAGFENGILELVPLDPALAAPRYSFEQVPSSPVAQIVPGPAGTLVVGYASGLVGLWGRDDGRRLARTRLHGSVAHLVLDGTRLYAATDLGDETVWDLGVFHAGYCDLVRQLWAQVPVTWRDGRPVKEPPPAAHPCAAARAP